MSLKIGTVLQETYRIVRRVGEGGMGEVYEATHTRLPGRFAVKVLLREIAGNREAFARFKREAEITSALRHPNIVHVIDFNKLKDGSPYLVMEFLDGEDIGKVLERSGPMSPRRTIPLIGQIASALAAAHAQGVVHRDLKPQNVFVLRVAGQDVEYCKVVDFGISKVRAATVKLTQEAAVLGSPMYMSPEQAQGRGDDVDGRTDQFALAAITYEALTGHEAFPGDTLAAVIYKVVHQDPPPLAEVATWPGVDVAGIDAVIRKAMAKKREHRFADTVEFHRALEQAARIGERSGVETVLEVRPSASDEEEVPASPGAQDVISGTRAYGEPEPSLKETTFSATAGEVTEPNLTQVLLRNRRVLVPAAVAALVLAVTGGLFVLRRPPAARSASPLALATPAAHASAAAAPEITRVPEVAARVTIHITDAPANLAVMVDGAPAELPITLPRGSAGHLLRFQAPGFYAREMKVDGRADHVLTLALKRTSAAGVGSAAVAPTGARQPGHKKRKESFVDDL